MGVGTISEIQDDLLSDPLNDTMDTSLTREFAASLPSSARLTSEAEICPETDIGRRG